VVGSYPSEGGGMVLQEKRIGERESEGGGISDHGRRGWGEGKRHTLHKLIVDIGCESV